MPVCTYKAPDGVTDWPAYSFEQLQQYGYDAINARPAAQREHSDITRDEAELPGMWSHSDFTGGDPDERSYAERQSKRAQQREGEAVAEIECIDDDGVRVNWLSAVAVGQKLYINPPKTSAVTDEEIEWLEYAIAHMRDDNEPEDARCAEVLQRLVSRAAREAVLSPLTLCSK
jgi:hypothetical protein